MANTVDDLSTAVAVTPLSDPSDLEDEIESLSNVTRTLPHQPDISQATISDTAATSYQANIATNASSILNSGTATFNIHYPAVAYGHVHRANDAFDGFSFKSTGIELGSSERRKEFIKQRLPRPALEQSDYTPYVQISDDIVTDKLTKIAQEFDFLDEVFAKCFQAFEEAFDHSIIRERLLRIRNGLPKRQCQSSDPSNSQDCYIGSLGEFCENVCASWKEPVSNRKIRGYRSGLKSGDDYLFYLQETLEIPYWKLVIGLLLEWRVGNESNIIGTAILYMLRYKVSSCKNKVEGLAQMDVPDAKDRDGLIAVMRSIRKRLDFLNNALRVVIPDEGLEVTASAITGVQGAHSELESGTSTAPLSTNYDASKQLALFVIFIILAFIPGYQGFAISAQSHENGTTSDSDFYYLMQSSIMSVLGNFATALPLLQSARVSEPSYLFFAFSAMGLFSAVLSVVIYPFTNPGWSSVVSFVGTVASAASVLVLTVATAREQMMGPRSRHDGEHIIKGHENRNKKLK